MLPNKYQYCLTPSLYQSFITVLLTRDIEDAVLYSSHKTEFKLPSFYNHQTFLQQVKNTFVEHQYCYYTKHYYFHRKFFPSQIISTQHTYLLNYFQILSNDTYPFQLFCIVEQNYSVYQTRITKSLPEYIIFILFLKNVDSGYGFLSPIHTKETNPHSSQTRPSFNHIHTYEVLLLRWTPN